MFELKQWDERTPIESNTQKPWGEYHVFQDFTVNATNPLPDKILNAIHDRFSKVQQNDPETKGFVRVLADPNNELFDRASADEKILVVEPKQPGYNILSMQYHGRGDMAGHIEVWEFLTDGVVVLGSDTFKPFGWSESEINDEMQNLRVIHIKSGEQVVILPGQWHALAMPQKMERVVVREWRITPEAGRSSTDREENIVRTFDNAGRGTLGNFPQGIMDEINR